MSPDQPPPDRPPDRPTERLQPSPPVREERYAAPAADANALLRLEDAVNSLRTALMVVGVLAVAALGVAIYSLMQADDDGGGTRSGLASESSVSELEDRVDRISRQVQDLREGDGDDGVEDRVAALEKTVKELADRPSADPQQAIDQLSKRIDEVAKDVEEIQRAPQSP